MRVGSESSDRRNAPSIFDFQRVRLLYLSSSMICSETIDGSATNLSGDLRIRLEKGTVEPPGHCWNTVGRYEVQLERFEQLQDQTERAK